MWFYVLWSVFSPFACSSVLRIARSTDRGQTISCTMQEPYRVQDRGCRSKRTPTHVTEHGRVLIGINYAHGSWLTEKGGEKPGAYKSSTPQHLNTSRLKDIVVMPLVDAEVHDLTIECFVFGYIYLSIRFLGIENSFLLSLQFPQSTESMAVKTVCDVTVQMLRCLSPSAFDMLRRQAK